MLESITVSPGLASGTIAAERRLDLRRPGDAEHHHVDLGAIAARLAHSTAPRPTRSSTASRLRCATTRSGKPFSTAFFAMPVP